ncbi:multidrug resistance-associated protein 5 [Tanacetum coccineum]
MTSKIDKGVEARTSTTKGVEARTSTTDKGKENVSQDATEVVEARISTVDKDYDSDYESKFDSDDDSDYHSDKLVDYLSPGEEELIKLRNKMKANREEKAKAKGNPVSEMNEPNDENSMHADNVRGDTFKEHDIYMNELLKSLKTADKDVITEDPFIFVEKHMERYLIYDETTHWRLRKPKVGEKYVTVDQFKECLTYYALANSFSLWYERTSRQRVVAKCGQRPPRLFVPEKDSYPVSTVKLGVTVNPDDKAYFDRFYVCFTRLADGWKERCRKIISLDVVNVENKDNWTWFLELLEQDLGSSKGNGLTLMSDQHKGLMEAVKDVMPNAEHMFWHVIPAGGNLFEVRLGSEGFTVDE